MTRIIDDAQIASEVAPTLNPELEARLLVAGLIGLSLAVLLEQDTAAGATRTIDYAIARLAGD